MTEVWRVKAVASRAFLAPLTCDEKDVALPCRHTQMIYDAARGPNQLLAVPNAYHTAALGLYPEEFKRRVLGFFATYTALPSLLALFRVWPAFGAPRSSLLEPASSP